MKRHIILYLISIIVLIAVGLMSRRISWIPNETGDMLWAMMVFCCWRLVMNKVRLSRIALLSLLTSYGVEFSQLVHTPWLDHLRSTFLGHMLLGQGFVWWDLFAYTLGVILAYEIFKSIESNQKTEQECI